MRSINFFRPCLVVAVVGVTTIDTLGAAVGAHPAALADTARRYSPAELDAAGRAVVSAYVAKYGLAQNEAWDRQVREILDRLQRAAAHPGLQLKPVIVRNDEFNAAAAPGGYMIINAGLIRFVEALGHQQSSNDQSEQSRRSAAFLAAVLSHEVAHITLGHSDALVGRLRELIREAGGGDTSITHPETYERQLRGNVAELEKMKYTRDLELAADRVGALYLLRAGWEIQTAMDLFRQLDSLERKSSDFYSIQALTYLSSHPRASTREAELEAFRARLKLDQAYFDDALTLISNNVELDAAIELLDKVLDDFPDLLAARHARGTAYHRKWLNVVSIQKQQLRVSLPTYSSRFLPEIRGLGTALMMERARADYEGVLSRQELPLTLSNLALLDAYGGDYAAAKQRAQTAVDMAPNDLELRNNLGVVLYLSGSTQLAKVAFQQATAAPEGQEYPPFVFNLGKTLHALHDPAARGVLERYLTLDKSSEWRKNALAMLGRRRGRTASELRSNVAGSPKVAGITLGTPPSAVIASLGQAERFESDKGQVLWHYPSRGLVLAVNRQTGVTLVLLTTRAAGALGGVAVGDPAADARARWGMPSEKGQGIWFFDRGTWFFAVEARNGTIERLGMGVID